MDVRVVVDSLVFGQFDDHPVGTDPDLVQQIECASVEKKFVAQAIEAGIDEQLSRKLQFRKPPEYCFATSLFQFLSQTMTFGGFEELFRRVQGAINRAANQAFEGDVRMRAKIDDGLKNTA